MTTLLQRVDFLTQSLWKRQRHCPHCRSTRHKALAHKYVVVAIRQCEDCGLSFTSPIYKAKSSASFYDEDYSAEGSTTETPNDEELKVLLETKFVGTDKDFHERLEAMRKSSEGTRLLEIGSSWGYFLFQAEVQGFVATGIEIGARRRRFAIEKLGQSCLESIDHADDSSFDLVYTSHVLEHFTDLSTIFASIHDKLVPGGQLFIEVPNFDFATQGKDVLPIIGAVHPLGFDSTFFEKNLGGYGFEILSIQHSWSTFCDGGVDDPRGDIVLVHARRD